jgi:hypothetical protein
MRPGQVLIIVVVATFALLCSLEPLLSPDAYAFTLAVTWVAFMVFMMAFLSAASYGLVPSRKI